MERNHIDQLNIRSFRGIRNLKMDDLGEINLLVGDNNCGKTSVLEVLRSIGNPESVSLWQEIAQRHPKWIHVRSSVFEMMRLLIDEKREEREIAYEVGMQGNLHGFRMTEAVEDMEISYPEAEASNLMFLRENADFGDELIPDAKRLTLTFYIDEKKVSDCCIYNFTNRRGEGGKERADSIVFFPGIINYISPIQHADAWPFLSEVFDTPELYESMLSVLRDFDPGVISINADQGKGGYLQYQAVKILSRDQGKALPLDVYGDGMKKAILLMSAVAASKNGILLIDEFETAIHTSAMKRLYGWLLSSCRKLNVQLFMTTHSIEAVDKLLAAAEDPDAIRVIRLKKKDGKTCVRTLNGTEALADRREYNMELRV